MFGTNGERNKILLQLVYIQQCINDIIWGVIPEPARSAVREY